jgi:3-oxoacyl-[acyl-carrier protein] reductase
MMIQKTVVITGAGIGIGRATALAFARRGYDVVVTDILESEGRSVVKEIEAEGGRGCFYKLDVTDSAAVDGVVREVESLNNGIDGRRRQFGHRPQGSARRNDGREMGLDHGR